MYFNKIRTVQEQAIPAGGEARLSPIGTALLPVDENQAASGHLEPGPAIWLQTCRKSSHIAICMKQGYVLGSTYQVLPSGMENIRL